MYNIKSLLQRRQIIRGCCGVVTILALLMFTRIMIYQNTFSPFSHSWMQSGFEEKIPVKGFSLKDSKRKHLPWFTDKSAKKRQKITYREMPEIRYTKLQNDSIQHLLQRNIIEPASKKVTKDTKIILWYRPTRYYPKLLELHPLRACPEAPCRVTLNHYFYNQSEAVVFTAQLLTQPPKKKLPNQVWILHNHESPRSWWSKNISLYKKKWKSQFNWTLDYRFDADIQAPYGIFKKRDGVFQKREKPPLKNYKDILSFKTDSIAWMVSQCDTMSKRMKYVKALQKYVNVDIIGGCGKKCSRGSDDACLADISKRYKFYLSFENAFCKDYITEKFFRFYNSDLVTIVRGGGNYTRIAPAGTYINTADFQSPRKLGNYIQTLLADDEKYLSILRKKDQYEAIFEDWPIILGRRIKYMTYHYDAVPLCELCQRLWSVDKHKKHYKDIGEWFDKGVCYKPTDI